MKDIKTLWIARNQDGRAYFYYCKPIRNEKWGVFTSCDFNANKIAMGYHDLFPEVTFENSPQQIELKLKEG